MPSFGTNSRKHRDTCDPQLQRVLDEAIKHYDFSCIWGHRGQEEQDKFFELGTSKVKWPNSKHNKYPSRAFDVIPYPDGFNASIDEFHRMSTHILAAASACGVRLRWGGHWTSFRDYAHFELMDND